MPLLLKVNLRILLFQIYRIRGYSPHLIGEGVDYLLAQDGSDNPVSEFFFPRISGRHPGILPASSRLKLWHCRLFLHECLRCADSKRVP